MKITHLVLHHNRFGVDTFLVNYAGKGVPSEKRVVKACNIDFEPDREEYLEIMTVSEDEVVKIK